MRIAVDKPDELRLRFARPIAIHEERDVVSRANGNSVGVPEDLLLGHC
jgi:hypothetical protein